MLATAIATLADSTSSGRRDAANNWQEGCRSGCRRVSRSPRREGASDRLRPEAVDISRVDGRGAERSGVDEVGRTTYTSW